MPTYRVELEDGRKFDVEADSQPTEADVLAKLAEMGGGSAAAAPPSAGGTGNTSESDMLLRAGKSINEAAQGAALEAPLMALRAAAVPQDVTSAAIRAGLRALGMKDLADKMEAQDTQLRTTVEAPFKAAPEASGAEKLGRLAMRTVPQMALAAATGGASLPMQSAVQGPAGAVQTAAEGGTPGEVIASGILGAGAPYAGPVLAKAGGWMSKTLVRRALDLYNRALHPTGAMKDLAEKVAPEMLDKGITAGPVEGLRTIEQAAENNLKPLGEAIRQTYETATAKGVKLNGEKLADALDPLKLPHIDAVLDEAGNPALATTRARTVGLNAPTGAVTTAPVPPVIKNPLVVGKIEEVQAVLRQYGKYATPKQIWGYRQEIDALVTRTGGFLSNTDEATLNATARRIRSRMAEALVDVTKSTTPNIEQLNGQYAFWKSLQDLTNSTIKRQVGQQKTGGLVLRYGLGSGLGMFEGYRRGGASGAAEGALAGAALVSVLRSPFARTWRAKEMNILADMLLGNAKALATPAGKRVATTLALFGIRAVTNPEEKPDEEPPAEPPPAPPAPEPTPGASEPQNAQATGF